MKTYISIFLIVFTLLISLADLYAVRATPYPVTITQNDGTELTILLKGDEFFHYKTTVDGYLLTTDAEGILNYAEIDKKGNLVNTRIKAVNIEKRTAKERVFVQQLKQNINFSKQNRMQRMKRSFKTESSALVRRSYPLTGTPKSLVILVNFKDVAFVTPNPQASFTNLLNQSGYAANGGTGSAKDYFRDNSMGVFNPQFDVVGPYTLAQTMDYYGKNDTTDNNNDTNPQQMIIEACTLASNNGVDFSQYDTDNDGFVDNIFVYYARYNEAEGGPANSVWPHRWALNNANTRFNGKTIYDYATTSELRGGSGSNMSGIGTFVHEFGHVLGLLDYYPTNDGTHQTLSYWSTMDSGPYLNSGRTPPAYSAYDRFYLDWLKPTELKVAGTYSLDALTTSNQAYLITENGNHNLNGQNPSPVEFFTLENRQKKGWDTYLPGHGMLITHIYYNATTWENNEPNNDRLAMGVDLVEADGIANNSTLSGDPFPGSKLVNSYIPTLRSGEEITNKSLSLINESNGIVSFQFISGNDIPITPPTATEATEMTIGSFIANWTEVNGATGYYLTVYNVSAGTSQMSEGFNEGSIIPKGWIITATKRTTSKLYSGKNVPAIQFSNSAEILQTEEYILPVTKLSFYIRSLGELNGIVRIEGKNQNTWSKLDSIRVNSQLNTTRSYEYNPTQNYTQFRLTYIKGNGDAVIDDITAYFGQNLEFNEHEKWTTENSDTIMNLIPNREYFYKVRASKKLLNPDQSILYENTSDFSNLIQVSTLEDKPGNIFRMNGDGTVQLLIPTTNITVRVYNTLGQLIRLIIPESNIFRIEGLPKKQVYIIEAGEYRTKIIL